MKTSSRGTNRGERKGGPTEGSTPPLLRIRTKKYYQVLPNINTCKVVNTEEYKNAQNLFGSHFGSIDYMGPHMLDMYMLVNCMCMLYVYKYRYYNIHPFLRLFLACKTVILNIACMLHKESTKEIF